MLDIKSVGAEAMETLPQRIKEELETKGGYYPLRVAWGQKPLTG